MTRLERIDLRIWRLKARLRRVRAERRLALLRETEHAARATRVFVTRGETRWRKAAVFIRKKVGAVIFEVVKEVLSALAKHALGL